MDDLKRIIMEKANELGHMIRDTDIFRDYMEVEELFQKDRDAVELLDEYEKVSSDIQFRQENGGVVEKFEIENMKNLAETVSQNDLIMEYLRNKNAYLELLLKIQSELQDDDLYPDS